MVLTADQIFQRVQDAPLRGHGDYFELSFRAMGSPCAITFAAKTHAAAGEFKEHALRWLSEFEAKYSRFIDSSLISRINAAAGREWVEVDAEAESLFSLCDWFHWTTDGVFDPTSGPFVALWDYHRQPAVVPSESEVAAARSLVGWGRVQRRAGGIFLPQQGMMLDIGGIGKEYAVDRVMNLALEANIKNVLVNFGNDLRVHGEPPEKGPWKVGLEHPDSPGRCWGGVALNEGAVCSSGNYLRFMDVGGKRYGHIIDPRTGNPVNNGCRSTTVIAPTCTEAGILATSSFVLGADAGMALLARQFSADGCIWTEGGLFETRRFRSYVIK
ncbi:MAG TPA: FAD:protein FMN transferase [Kiritimatiellia bacterium]|nr:FAD:protein FMN transferase [Kiritimatiellia bacterium]